MARMGRIWIVRVAWTVALTVSFPLLAVSFVCWPKSSSQRLPEASFFHQAPSFPRHRATTMPSAEVIGASGRMGTFWLQAASSNRTTNETNTDASANVLHAVPVHRGETPGRQTTMGCPIYVATPSDAYPSIYEATPIERRKDLVFVGNAGLSIDDRYETSTLLVPHFSVLYTHQWGANSTQDYERKGVEIQINTDPVRSPPTMVYGTHANEVCHILHDHGIRTELVESLDELRAHSGRKLVWASCLWLLCHNHPHGNDSSSSNNNNDAVPPPLTVGEVHEVRSHDLERLVDEILPVLKRRLLPESDGETEEHATIQAILDRTTVLGYLAAYSKSIPRAVPSVALARREFADRNGVWLRHAAEHGFPQGFHRKLLRAQGVVPDAE